MFFWLHWLQQPELLCFVDVSEQVLHQRLGQRGVSQADHTQDQVIGSGMDRSLPGLPQRERTMIGGDSEQDVNETFHPLLCWMK